MLSRVGDALRRPFRRVAETWLSRRWATTRRLAVAVVTYGLLSVAFVLGILWFVWPDPPRWEPAVNSLTLVAGVTGLLVERLNTEAERRAELFASVRYELTVNLLAIDLRLQELEPSAGQDAVTRVSPRIVVSAVDAALVSGALARRTDAPVVARLHRWREAAHGYNRRRDLAETLTAVEAALRSASVGALRADLGRESGFLAEVRSQLCDLLDVVPDR
ncbi:hypothetical protein L1785_19915 [Antribacter sp. KLBMP9083]|uniref:Uncharacterized protein n=1 Tax=Antribacter soli TaxID=2910976 RepID=A0AA41U978_9MICO|nr:hypothetical protein [Antribacter soli]MCF4123240.1 hypothetical protein [Antribacter soli]